MKTTQQREKSDVAADFRKVQEMIDLQHNSNYLTDACNKWESRIKDANSPRELPKTVMSIVEDVKRGETCDQENFASKTSI